ncbi:AAA family ATPase [Pseudarthrobacter sp. N5]|uniref:AAA family ATPase n=1 Tax=Pseudarthrobacter sp. N5 TaxID=3418416 RepID=UPI003CEDA1A6
MTDKTSQLNARESQRVILTPASMIRTRRQKWFWAPRKGCGVIPLGTGTIAAGKGGEGKTTFVLDLIGQLTRGELPGDLYGVRGTAIIIGPEDDWDTIMVPRLQAAGADLDKVYKIDVETSFDEITRQRSLKFPMDVDSIAEAVHETGAKIVVLDPAPSLMHGDMNKVQDVRHAYEPLMALAQRFELAMILINHFGKGGGSVSSKLSGSHAWRDLTRSYLAFATDEETGERVFSQDKNNYAETKGSYKFALESVDVTTDDGEITSVARVNFLGETDTTVSDIINRGFEDAPEGGEDRTAAQKFIAEYLTESGGECLTSEIEQIATRAGFTVQALRKARMKMVDPVVMSKRVGFGKGSKFIWSFVIDSGIDSIDSRAPHAGINGIYRESMTGMKEVSGIYPLIDSIDSVLPGMGTNEEVAA